MSRKLPHYIRTYRRRYGLSQDEMASLLACRNGSKVCRYERFARQPTLETALAYEAVFGTPVRALFAGMYQQTLAKIRKRARILAKRIQNDGGPKRKVEFLKALSHKTDYYHD